MNIENFEVYRDMDIANAQEDELLIAQFDLQSLLRQVSYIESFYPDIVKLYNDICEEIYKRNL